ncbi:fatty acid alpha-hydroxylase [Actinomortierella wolfii]|nr:fatty acid alpha-hydroxylase [Actinomortierella wolfii]
MAPVKTFSKAEVAKHNKADDCWIIVDGKVYDVSGFVADHPGGEEYILDHAGEDLTALLQDENEHLHSDVAYEILEELMVGHIESSADSTATLTTPTVQSTQQRFKESDELFKDTDIVADKKERFLDLSKPLLYQLWKANYPKDFYMKQVHIPRHLPHSARIFESDFLEIFSRTPWWLVPLLWLPVAALLFSWSIDAERQRHVGGALPIEVAAGIFVFGVFFWTLAEYGIHRFLFHVDELLPESTYSNVAHFLLHGIHHYLPMDRLRLVMPPVLTVFLGTPIYLTLRMVLPSAVADAMMSGVFFGYICYDMVHYYLHHARVIEFHFKEMKTYHLAHHYKQYDNGYGITSKIWDRLFGTLIDL